MCSAGNSSAGRSTEFLSKMQKVKGQMSQSGHYTHNPITIQLCRPVLIGARFLLRITTLIASPCREGAFCRRLTLTPIQFDGVIYIAWKRCPTLGAGVEPERDKLRARGAAVHGAALDWRTNSANLRYRLFSSTETGNSTRRSHTVETTQSEKPISTNGVGS